MPRVHKLSISGVSVVIMEFQRWTPISGLPGIAKRVKKVKV
jgi:hypothetical protein